MTALPKDISTKIRYHLDHIAEIFRTPVITLIVRDPLQMHGEGDIVITADDIDKAIEALERRKTAIMMAQLQPFRQN